LIILQKKTKHLDGGTFRKDAFIFIYFTKKNTKGVRSDFMATKVFLVSYFPSIYIICYFSHFPEDKPLLRIKEDKDKKKQKLQ